MKYDGVIFDNDGVLIEIHRSGDVYEKALKKLFKQQGVKPAKKDLKPFLYNRNVRKVEKICKKYGLNTREFWKRKEELTYGIQKKMILDGYKTLYSDTDVLRDINLPMGIVSNNQQAIVDFIAKNYAEHSFECSYGREKSLEGLSRRKPDTYYLKKCMSDMNVKNPLFIGDSSVDIEVAHKMGIDSVFIRREHREGYYVTKRPTYEIKSLEELPGILN